MLDYILFLILKVSELISVCVFHRSVNKDHYLGLDLKQKSSTIQVVCEILVN